MNMNYPSLNEYQILNVHSTHGELWSLNILHFVDPVYSVPGTNLTFDSSHERTDMNKTLLKDLTQLVKKQAVIW